MSRFVRQLRQAQELSARGMDADQLAGELKAHPFVARKLMGFVRGSTKKEWLKKERACLDADRLAKSTGVDLQVLCHRLLSELCAGKR